MITGIITAILLICFLAGTAWAYGSGRKTEFEEAARLALDDGVENAP
jgi:cytochrome c oxidase cbb3-type subunit 4